MATDYRRFYCQIRVDSTFDGANLPRQSIKKLNEKIENVLEEWSTEMTEKGLSTDIGWNWSEHTNL